MATRYQRIEGKRYKGYKSLNKMIEELENTVITVNKYTGEVISPNIVTKKTVTDYYRNIIDDKTGKFLSYQEAKNKVMRSTGQSFSFSEYQDRIAEFQDSSLSKQLTLEGEKEYQINRGIKIFGKAVMDDILDSVSYSNYRLIIDRIGRLSNELEQEGSNYTSDTFYDMITMVLENIDNGVDIETSLTSIETLFTDMFKKNTKDGI